MTTSSHRSRLVQQMRQAALQVGYQTPPQLVDRLNEAIEWMSERDNERLKAALPIAREILDACLQSSPNDPQVRKYDAIWYGRARDFETARIKLREVWEILPTDIDVLSNLSVAEKETGNIRAALGACMRALELSQDPRYNPLGQPAYHVIYNYGMASICAGDYRGWNGLEYGAMIGKITPPPKGIRWWRGGPVACGRLVVYSEQGIGDNILHARFLPRIRAQSGAHLVYAVMPEAYPLMRTQTHLADEIVLNDARVYEQPCEAVSIVSLPSRLKVCRPEDVLSAPYILRPAALERTGGVPCTVGLCWQGNPLQEDDARRSIFDLSLLNILRDTPGVEFVSLQKRASEIPDFVKPGIEEDWDLLQTADFIYQSCDAVLTVCTSVAHLSAAMGVPTYCMVHKAPYYIWGLEGETTPWYPSMRLLRQQEAGNWQPVLVEASRRLARLGSES